MFLKWVADVTKELGVDIDVDVGDVLELAREAEEGVARPAAPLTTFLVGYAAAKAGGGSDAVRDVTARVRALLTESVPEQ